MLVTISLPDVVTALLCTHGEDVRPAYVNHETLVAATLMELELDGRIRSSQLPSSGLPQMAPIAAFKLEVLDRSLSADKLLGAVLGAIQDSSNREHMTLPESARAIAGLHLRETCIASLVEAGWLVEVGKRTLVRHRPKYRVADQAAVEATKVELFDRLLGDEPLGDRDQALAALLAARGGGLEGGPWTSLRRVLPRTTSEGSDRGAEHARLKQATARAVEAMKTSPIAHTLYLELEAEKRRLKRL